jgi:hypothetical protein
MPVKAVFTSLLLVLLFARATRSQQPAAQPPPAEPTVVASSGQNQLDEGAIKVARSGAGKYIPPTKDGKAVPGCIKFRDNKYRSNLA